MYSNDIYTKFIRSTNMSFVKVPLSLTEKQFHKLRLGYPIQLTHAQLCGGDHWLAVHHETHKKMSKSHAKKKGVRIQLSPAEVEASGEGLKEFWEKVKSGAKWVKEKIIDTPFY